MVNDPIANFITQIRNAVAVKKERVEIPYSKLIHALASILQREGYLVSVEKSGKEPTKSLLVTLSYEKGAPFRGIKRVSRLSRRVYLGVRGIRPVKFGYGRLILTTPQGLMTGEEARKKRLGGEALIKVW